jgi:hypothetical protein
MARDTEKLPYLKPSSDEVGKSRPKTGQGIFSPDLQPTSSPEKSGKEIVDAMKKLAKKDLFVTE